MQLATMRHGLLTAVEERELSERVMAGDIEARDTLVLKNQRLVAKIARGFLGRGMELGDIIGNGNVGLIHAAEQYDHRVGTRFTTYAAHWVRQAIQRGFLREVPAIRLPQHIVQTLLEWHRVAGEIEAGGEAAASDRVAERLRLRPAQREMVRNALACRHVAPYEDDQPTRDAEHRDLGGLLGGLDAVHCKVLRLHFGLDGTPLGFDAIGVRCGLTSHQARRTLEMAIECLRRQSSGCESPDSL